VLICLYIQISVLVQTNMLKKGMHSRLGKLYQQYLWHNVNYDRHLFNDIYI